MPSYVELLCEKDAIAGVIQPVTWEYDVPLRVVRGYASVSFAGEIADTWAEIQKPIHAYYVGDWDPSGHDIERDLRSKLCRYMGADEWSPPPFQWHRLAVVKDDFRAFDLLRLPVKRTDKRAAAFLELYGHDCAEVDALPPDELRRRVEEAIFGHVDREKWERLKVVEAAERQTVAVVAARLAGAEPYLIRFRAKSGGQRHEHVSCGCARLRRAGLVRHPDCRRQTRGGEVDGLSDATTDGRRAAALVSARRAARSGGRARSGFRWAGLSGLRHDGGI